MSVKLKEARSPKVDDWFEDRIVPGSKADPRKEQETLEKQIAQREADRIEYEAMEALQRKAQQESAWYEAEAWETDEIGDTNGYEDHYKPS